MRALTVTLWLVACTGDTGQTPHSGTESGPTDSTPTGDVLVDHGDGTATAPGGLTWEVAGSTEGLRWQDAVAYCDGLALAGGGWHLPTIGELRTLIRGCETTVTGGSCGIDDTCTDLACRDASCYVCAPTEGPTDGCYGPAELPGPCEAYWSSSMTENGDAAWFVSMIDGHVFSYGLGNRYHARCARP